MAAFVAAVGIGLFCAPGRVHAGVGWFTTKRINRILKMLTLAALGAALTAQPADADVSGGVISSAGPLTRVQTTADLNCAVNHASDSAGEFFGDTACGTLVAVDGTLYGPASIPAGGSASPRTPWTTESQTGSGSGTAIDPYRVVTIVNGGGLRLTQTDTYVVGSEAYGTRIAISNTTGAPKDVTLYRAGDCYLQDSDHGYGAVDTASGAVACVTSTDPESRVEQWAPLTAGSRYYEAGYSSVWAAIGSQAPFPNTCACATRLDNGAGLSWTTSIAAGATSSFSHLTAFSPTGDTQVEDSDGDGFPDTWEAPDGGVDTDGDGTPDLKLSDYGATPDRADVFVQVAWTKTRSCVLAFFCSTKNRRPSLAALRDVQRSFKTRGVRLHVDAGPDSVMNPDNNAKWGSRSRAGDGVEAPARIPGWENVRSGEFDWSQAFDGHRNRLLPSERARLFHFMLYVGTFDPDGYSGISRSNTDDDSAGRDLLFAYDSPAFDSSGPSRIEEAGTFMHELGHNLGLSHGGSIQDDRVNYKPNYPSIMNYWWQLSGVYKDSTLGGLDYSKGTLDALNENALNESAGLEPDSAAADIATRWSCPNGGVRRPSPSPSVRDTDWNCRNGPSEPGTYSSNVNSPAYDPQGPDLTEFQDHNDWGSLTFDGGGALGGAGDPGTVAASTPIKEAEPADLKATAGDLRTVELGGPGQLSIQSNTTAPVKLTVTNRHDQERTYDLAVIANGVSLSGLPPQLTLAGGQTRTLTATLSAGPATDSAFFEVNGTSDDPRDADSAITEVFVVDRVVPDQPKARPLFQGPLLAPARDMAAPVVRQVRVTPNVFAVARSRTAVNARLRRGTKVRYALSELAAVRITIQRSTVGRRRGARCVRPTRRLARARRCNRYRTIGALTRRGAPGVNSTKFSGRIGAKRLAAGRYRIAITAIDTSGNRSTQTRTARFRVVRPRTRIRKR